MAFIYLHQSFTESILNLFYTFETVYNDDKNHFHFP